MAGNKSRKSPRAHVALVARYRSPTAFEFVEEECVDLSSGGMFIKSKAPAPSGTLLKLECDLDGGQATMRAVARVVWLRERDLPDEPRGMGVKFVKLEPGGRELIAQVLERVGSEEGAGPQARSSIPPPPEPLRAASAISLAPALVQQQARVESTASLQTALIEVKPPGAPASDPAPAPPAATHAAEAPKKEVAPPAAKPKVAPPPPKNDAHARRSSAAPRSDVPTDRPPPGQRGVDMRAIGIGVLLMGVVAVIAVVSQSGKERDATETVTSEPAAQPPSSAPEPAPATQVFELRLTTLPNGALVTAGGRTGLSPMTVELGTLTGPVEVRVEKEGFETLTSTVELERFVEADGKRVAQVMLALPALREPADDQANVNTAPQVEPTAAPTPAPAAARAAQAAAPAPEKARPARSARRATPKPEEKRAAAAPSEPAPAVAAAPAPIETPAPVAEVAPTPAPAAPPAASPAPAPAAPKPTPIAPMTSGTLTPMQAARACLARNDAACAIGALEGRARTAQELELLIETYRSTGNDAAASKYMKQYVERFPTERRASAYSAQLGLPAPQ